MGAKCALEARGSAWISRSNDFADMGRSTAATLQRWLRKTHYRLRVASTDGWRTASEGGPYGQREPRTYMLWRRVGAIAAGWRDLADLGRSPSELSVNGAAPLQRKTEARETEKGIDRVRAGDSK